MHILIVLTFFRIHVKPFSETQYSYNFTATYECVGIYIKVMANRSNVRSLSVVSARAGFNLASWFYKPFNKRKTLRKVTYLKLVIMADVLDIENVEEFEVDDEGERKYHRLYTFASNIT